MYGDEKVYFEADDDGFRLVVKEATMTKAKFATAAVFAASLYEALM